MAVSAAESVSRATPGPLLEVLRDVDPAVVICGDRGWQALPDNGMFTTAHPDLREPRVGQREVNLRVGGYRLPRQAQHELQSMIGR